MNGDFSLLHKTNFLNSAVHVPLIIATPQTATGSARGSFSATPVELFDVGATLVELAGSEIQYPQYAKSLCPVITDPSQTHRTEAISEIFGEMIIYDGCWKYAVSKDGQGYLLFNLQDDPNEHHNLAGLSEAKEEEERMRTRLFKRLVQSLHPDDFANGTWYTREFLMLAGSQRHEE